MSKKTELDRLKIQEYAQKRKIEQLRSMLFSKKSEDISENMDRLLEAEEELLKLETKRNSLTQNNNKGLILSAKVDDSKSSSEVVVRGRGKTKGEIEIEVNIGMEYIPTAIYHLFEPDELSLVICLIKATGTTKQIKVTSYIEGYSAKAINTIEVQANKMESLYQLPTLFPHLIENITELTKATLHVKVEEIGGDFVKEDSYPISLLSRNSAIHSYYNPKEDEIRDISYYLGVFVTPNHPDIIRFLRTVAEFHPSKSLGGYQGNEEGDKEFISGKKAVETQVKAIFNALKERELIYTNSVIDFNPHQNFYGQRVRLPKEVLKERQANCLDGTFLYVSLLEACSLNPAIVLTPTHAFLAWETWEGNGEWQFLETTITSSHSFEDACMVGGLTAQKHLEKKNLKIIPINELRAKGVMPME